MKHVVLAVDQLKANGMSDDADFLLQILDKSAKPVSNLVMPGLQLFPTRKESVSVKGAKQLSVIFDREVKNAKTQDGLKVNNEGP